MDFWSAIDRLYEKRIDPGWRLHTIGAPTELRCEAVTSQRTYSELVELARMCWRQARVSTSEEVARELWRMAREYQQEAAKLDGGKLPDISDPQTT